MVRKKIFFELTTKPKRSMLICAAIICTIMMSYLVPDWVMGPSIRITGPRLSRINMVQENQESLTLEKKRSYDFKMGLKGAEDFQHEKFEHLREKMETDSNVTSTELYSTRDRTREWEATTRPAVLNELNGKSPKEEEILESEPTEEISFDSLNAIIEYHGVYDKSNSVLTNNGYAKQYKLYDGNIAGNISGARGKYMKVKKLWKNPEDVPIHPLSYDEPYHTRLRNIQTECEKDADGDFANKIDLSRFVYDDRHKLIMCVVPKDACTTWKSIMYYFRGRSTLESAFEVDVKRLVLNHGHFPTMVKLSKDEVLSRMNTYTTFMVTRHPFDRIVSAYKNKFKEYSRPYATSFGREMAFKAAKEYLPELQINWRMSKTAILSFVVRRPDYRKLLEKDQKTVLGILSKGIYGKTDFKTFLKYGAIERPHASRQFDVHWKPQHMLCNPCAINYDYVIRFEDLANESDRLLDWVQSGDPYQKRISFPRPNTPPTSNNATMEEFSTIPQEMQKILKEIYRRDFQYFNHNPDIF